MKLSAIAFNVDIRELPRITHADTATPPEILKGWSVTIEGPSVYLASPPGWRRGLPLTDDKTITTIEVPRNACSFRWTDDKPVSSTAKHGPQIFGALIVAEEKGKKA